MAVEQIREAGALG